MHTIYGHAHADSQGACGSGILYRVAEYSSVINGNIFITALSRHPRHWRSERRNPTHVTSKRLIVHIDKLKLCHMEGLVSWHPTDDVKLSNQASDGIHVSSSPLEPIHVSSSAYRPTHANDDNLFITTKSPAAIYQSSAHDVTSYASLSNAHVALRPRSSIQEPFRFRCRTKATPQ